MSPLWLKSLPWSTIVSNAPLIVDGAKKLVSLVKRKSTADASALAADTSTSDPRSELVPLRARIQQLEQEQRQAAELLHAMAENQGRMAQALEALRSRARLSLCVALVSLVGIAALLLWTLTH
jgi:hypothetical protein